MIAVMFLKRFVIVVFLVVIARMSSLSQTARDLIEGNLIQINDNGAWRWYQVR